MGSGFSLYRSNFTVITSKSTIAEVQYNVNAVYRSILGPNNLCLDMQRLLSVGLTLYVTMHATYSGAYAGGGAGGALAPPLHPNLHRQA